MKLKAIRAIFGIPSVIMHIILFIWILNHIQATEGLWIIYWVSLMLTVIFTITGYIVEDD